MVLNGLYSVFFPPPNQFLTGKVHSYCPDFEDDMSWNKPSDDSEPISLILVSLTYNYCKQREHASVHTCTRE